MTPGAYRLALDAIVWELTAISRPLVRLFLADPTPRARASLVGLLLPHVTSARERAYRVSVRFLEAQRIAQGAPTAAVVPDIRRYEPNYLDRAIVAALNNYPNSAESALVGAVAVHAQQAARAVPQDSAQLYNNRARFPAAAAMTAVRERPRAVTAAEPVEVPVPDEPDDEDEPHEEEPDDEPDEDDEDEDAQGWARLLTGAESCAFCVTLAGRGAVYSTREAAIENASGQAYHLGCDCITVPVFARDAWPGWAEARKLAAFYAEATARYPDTPKLNAVRRLLAEHGAPLVADLRSAA